MLPLRSQANILEKENDMEPEIDTKPTGATLTKAQAIELNNALAGRRPQVRYLTHFDTHRIYRQDIGRAP